MQLRAKPREEKRMGPKEFESIDLEAMELVSGGNDFGCGPGNDTYSIPREPWVGERDGGAPIPTGEVPEWFSQGGSM